MENVQYYAQTAKIFHDEKILSVSLNMCIHSIQEVEPSSSLLKFIDPDFFYDIISSPEVDTCSMSCHISKIVASFCRFHQGELDEETFEKLTDRRFIPLIDKESAMDLLDLEVSITSQNNKLSLHNLITTTTCLQKRCINVLAQHWNDFSEDTAILRSFPPMVVSELFERTITVAKNDRKNYVSSVKIEIGQQAEKLTNQHQQEAHEVQKQVDQERAGRAKIKEELQETRRLLALRDWELNHYRREWKRMIRVPVNHTFPRDVKRCTYQSTNEPFDHPNHLVGRYGKVRPTAMPTIGDSPEDGYLFLQKSGNFLERWPMFYYCSR